MDPLFSLSSCYALPSSILPSSPSSSHSLHTNIGSNNHAIDQHYKLVDVPMGLEGNATAGTDHHIPIIYETSFHDPSVVHLSEL
jgi:hypothetical protein